jgi:hypothetical protein
VSTWLSAAWLEQAAGALGALALPSAPTASVRCTVAGGAEDGSDVVTTARLADGRLVDWAPGDDGDVALALTLSDADAWAVLSGEVGLPVAFMQGRLKVEGDMAIVLELLAQASTPAAEEARSSLAEATQR